MSKRLVMTVTMQVTEPQAIALQAFFEEWNRLASWGSSRMVAFYVDGDGNFKPKCRYTFSEPIHELTEELASLAAVEREGSGLGVKYDFDPVAWKLRELRELRELKGAVSSDHTSDGVKEAGRG